MREQFASTVPMSTYLVALAITVSPPRNHLIVEFMELLKKVFSQTLKIPKDYVSIPGPYNVSLWAAREEVETGLGYYGVQHGARWG